MLVLVPLLFGSFLIGTLIEIRAMLERKRAGGNLERYRLVFFFVACLMLVCLIPLWLSELLTRAVWATNIAVVGTNILGWALTFSRPEGEEEASRVGIRTYTLYYQGTSFGLITRETFDRLAEFELLKKQRTVELVDDYQEKARQQGVRVQLFQNEDRSQTLVKVEVPEKEKAD